MPLNVWTFLIESINDAIKIIYIILHPTNITFIATSSLVQGSLVQHLRELCCLHRVENPFRRK